VSNSGTLPTLLLVSPEERLSGMLVTAARGTVRRWRDERLTSRKAIRDDVEEGADDEGTKADEGERDWRREVCIGGRCVT
jgi:hypothetical protein